MRGDDRRHQLLDAAADLVVEHGAAAMSMERLAAVAGVSKALPYKHFDNGEAVLAALYRRETAALGRAVWRALSEADPDDDLVRLAIRIYFDEVARRGPVLAALSGPGSTIASVADPAGAGVVFEVEVEVFDRFHGVDRDRAKAVAGMVQGAVVGATGTWLAGHGTREELEDDLVAVLTTLIARAPR
jgi:AcrR family transcriptional regulator